MNAQSKEINGKVISEELEELPEVHIYDTDTSLLGTTDLSGNFSVTLPVESDQLILSWIGMEWLTISMPKDCDHLEVIMLSEVLYHYKSHRKIDRLRKRRFDQLIKLHSEASTKGIFESDLPCFQRKFIPNKPELDENRIWMKEVKKDIKSSFEELSIGDSINIPYSGSWRYDGTNRTALFSFSSYVEGTEFECLIQGIVIDKNKRKNGYNLIFKVTDCNTCNYYSIVFEGREMRVGEVFHHNMKYSKVLSE